MPTSSTDNRMRVAAWALLALVCWTAFFGRLGSNGLFDLDEALYANAARGMAVTGDYVTPRVNGIPFFEKPPLIYWEAAGAFHLLGQSELAARLPSALASAALVALVCLFGSRFLGRRAGFLAAFLLALSPLTLATARQLTTDATVDLWVFSALACFFLGYTGAEPRSSRWYYAAWAAVALGVLAKGGAGAMALPIALLFLVFAERHDAGKLLAQVRRACPVGGIALFLLIAAPWHVAAYRASGHAFFDEYVIRQHLGRFRGGDKSHPGPFWFYVPTFLLLFFPWSLLFPAALLRRRDSKEPDNADRLRLLLKVWACVVFLAFSASGSKLVSYILPMFPPAALLVADWLVRAIDRADSDRALRWASGVAASLCLFLFGVVAMRGPIIEVIERVGRRPVAMDAGTRALFGVGQTMLLAAALGAAAWFVLTVLRRRALGVAAALAGMAALVVLAVAGLLPAVDEAFSRPLQGLARQAGVESGDGAAVLTGIRPPSRPSILFYLPPGLVSGTAPTIRGRVPDFDSADELRAALPATQRAVILTDDKRATALLTDPRIRQVARRGKWILLRWNPGGEKAG